MPDDTTFRRLAQKLGPRARMLGRDLAPAARLARLDSTVLRAWLRRIRPIRDALGQAEADAYTAMVVDAAAVDPEVARLTAYTLPDHLARVPSGLRGRYLSLLRAVLGDRPSAVPMVIRTLPELLDRMDDESLSRYLARGLDLHRTSSSKAESFLRMESHTGQQEVSKLVRGVQLADLRRTLSLYARAHCGADVQVVSAASAGGKSRGKAFTDGRNLYLPDTMDMFGDARDRMAYRVLTARNAGYLEFGTLDLELDTVPAPTEGWPTPKEGELEHERLVRALPNSSLAMDLFQVLENLRIEARVRAEYPGVARDMDVLADSWRGDRPDPSKLAPAEQAVEWLQRVALGLPVPDIGERAAAAAEVAAEELDVVRAPGATVADTASAVVRAFQPIYGLLRKAEPPPGGHPGASGKGAEGGGRGGRQPDGRGNDVGSDDPRLNDANRDPTGDASRELDYRPAERDPLAGELRGDLLGEGERQVEERARAMLAALRGRGEEGSMAAARAKARDGSTYEEMAEFLDRMEAPAGPARDAPPVPQRMIDELRPADGVELDGDLAPRAFLYPEWDAGIDDHKPAWVRVTEYHLKPGSSRFVEEVKRDHGPLIGQIRRAFEALRPEEVRRVRGVEDGDEIDIDRAVDAIVERRAGGSPSDRVYARRERHVRDVSVAFLVDMSSSTNELANGEGKRIIDVEKAALVLIAEAVDAIGDAAAIYGFSGYGRDQVAFYVAKDFDDPWDDRVRERIGRISWKMENRDGAAIRHCTTKLAARRSRVKLMLLLSDGKPLDCGCDHYADRYAQEDTRMALSEARKAGIHPFCITVDPQGQHYLQRVYGEHGYTVIDRVDALPKRLPLIYRRMTR